MRNKAPCERRGEIDAAGNTYNDDSAGDGDSRQHAVGDGVWFYGVHDALVVAVNPSFIWLEHDGHNDEGQCRCGENKPED